MCANNHKCDPPRKNQPKGDDTRMAQLTTAC